MIIGKIHPGSGLGDQLFSYIITRVIALDKGYEFGFVGKEFFKGNGFMQLDWGKDTESIRRGVLQDGSGQLIILDDNGNWYNEKHFKFDKPYYDPEVNFIEDGTVIDGYGAQDERYWGHRLKQIREWLKTEPLPLPSSVCVMNIRGGEFKAVPELFLPKEYWEQGMKLLREKYNYKNLQEFMIHTDDPFLAEEWFPDHYHVSDIEINWRSIRYAKHLIISNSAFAIIPALLNENVKEVIAPKYWNRRNLGRWDWPMNYYKKFTYI